MKNFIISLSLCIILLSCEVTQEGNEKLNVVTTTSMIYDAVINIGGDKVDAIALMGPGVDPHLYKATQGDLSKLRNADLVIYHGLHLEGKMGEVFEKLGRVMNVKAATDKIPDSLLRESETFQGTFDPHIWFDVSLWKRAIKQVSENMSSADTANANYYAKRTANYLDRMDSLHLAVKQEIISIPAEQRMLITAHDAFGYFGDAYNIQVKGLQSISTISEPGLKDIANLVNTIVNRKINAVFIETSVSEKAINAVVEGCKEKGHIVKIGGSLYSDAMGPFEKYEGTYIGMVNANVRTIVNALK